MRSEAKERTRQHVLQAAWGHFETAGYEKTTIRDIAAAANVSVGSVMAVGDKASLLVQTFDAMIAAEHQGNDRAAATGDNCAERCRSLVTPFVTLFATHAPLARHYGAILLAGNHHSRIFTDLAAMLQREFRAAVNACGCAPTPLAAHQRTKAFYFAYLGALFSWASANQLDANLLDRTLAELFSAICPNAKATP